MRAPEGALLLAAPFDRVRAIAGDGWRMRSPVPSAIGVLALRLPFALEADGVIAGAARVSFAELAAVQPVGRRVVVSRRTFARLASPAGARRLAELLREVAGAEPVARATIVERSVRESLSLERATDAKQNVERATRWLALLCDAYALAAFGALPVMLWLDYEDRVLRAVLPALGVLHLTGVALVFRAHRRISPEARSGRFDLAFMSFLFPPALLASPKALWAEGFAGVHPLAAAAVLLAPRDFASFARRERARLEDPQERAGLDAICRELEVDLASPPPHLDPEAASYCPRCFSDFRPGYRACSDCEVNTVAYPSP